MSSAVTGAASLEENVTADAVSHILSIVVAISATWFALMNFATFLLFAFDKARARKTSGSRVSERTLLLLGALGGWPGGVLAMLLLRHKTAKLFFQLKYALAVFPFGLLLFAAWKSGAFSM